MIRLLVVIVMSLCVMPAVMFAQNCPENVGFENGSFQNWKLYTGWTEISLSKNTVTMSEIYSPESKRQTMMTDKAQLDPYGNFPVISKDGGNFSIKLGNDGTGAEAEGVSYLLNIPLSRPEFTLTYQYAIVLEDPNHDRAEQPRFIARVKDVSTGEYIPCASFEYIATSTLPGFKQSESNSKVIYKDWSAVTINLSGYEGKQLLLEFITADCTLNGHFGYAYVDVSNVCGDLIVGNKYCKGLDEMKISGPSGFKTYNWFNEDRSVKYGTGQAISIKPTPTDGSRIYLDLVPYDGYGCPSTISAIAKSVDYQIKTLAKDIVCSGSSIDLLSSKYILNRVEEFDYLVYEDSDLLNAVKNLVVTQNKTYYVKATNYKGCESVSSIEISLNDINNITAINPEKACVTGSVDITKNEIYNGNLEGITRSYYTDKEGNAPLDNPDKITNEGIYYAKLVNGAGCIKMLPVVVGFMPKPKLIVKDPAGVCSPNRINLSEMKNFAESDADLTYTFFTDAELRDKVADPLNVDKAGTYYVKAVNLNGCEAVATIIATIYNLPTLSITNPQPVCFPATVDITKLDLYKGSSPSGNFSYFLDQDLTIKLNNPSKLSSSGIYYVKITNPNGCYSSNKIEVTVNGLPTITVNKPKVIFDNEHIDLTSPLIIKGSKNYKSVSYYTDETLTKKLDNPSKISKAGVYYISLTNETGCSVVAPVELDILPSPKIVVPTAFTPQQQTNNHLYPFVVSINKLLSFKVFNKWGILVYESDNMQALGWNGHFKNKLQPFETFSWYAEGIDLLGGRIQSQGKTIMIL